MDDKTAQTTRKVCSKDTGQNVTRVRKLHKAKREQAKTESSDERWITSRQENKRTWEASTLTVVSQEQREDKNNMPNSSTCCRLNTDHKDVAMVAKFKPHLHSFKNMFKQFQRCFSFSTAFLMSQYLAFTSLSSFLQHLGGCADLVASNVQQASSEARRVLVPYPW